MTTMPDTPGEWWFTGTVTIPHSSAPGNHATVHLAQPRRILMVESAHFGLLPVDPQTHECYGMYTFIGTWESSKRPAVTTHVPRKLTAWMEAQHDNAGRDAITMSILRQ